MRVVLYMRYSSDHQTEQSIEGQQRVCRAFCEQQGYTIVDTYIDRAFSAYKDTEKRVAFLKMIKDSEKGLWDAVVVYKLDRFSRNRYDSATYKAKLKKNGVRVISATENISENPEGVILEAVLEGMAEFYSKELAQKINRGMIESAYKCHNLGGHIPLGYNIENKKLVINDAEAEIVREAFREYANGSTVADICDAFNNKGYRTAKGAKFNKNSFRSMFKNERYIGIYSFKDIRIEGGVPAIIDKETFDIVQKRLKINALAPARGKAKVDYLLSQKMYCGRCGKLMIGDTSTSKTGKKHHYYSCSSKKNHHTCDKTSIKKDLIERLVVEDVCRLITPEKIEELATMAIKANQEDIDNNLVVKQLETDLVQITTSINNLVKMIERGVMSDAIDSRLTELEAQKRDLDKRIAFAKDDVIVLEKEHVVWWLTQFCKGDINDTEFCKRIIDLLVQKVVVYDDKHDPTKFDLEIIYNLHSQKPTLLEGASLKCSAPPKEYYSHTLWFVSSFMIERVTHTLQD